MSSKITLPDDPRDLPLAIVKQMLTLATSGLGLAAALAWNEAVKAAIELYVKPFLPKNSAVLSHVIYAAVVTALAVIVTLQLTKLQQQLEKPVPPGLRKPNPPR